MFEGGHSHEKKNGICFDICSDFCLSMPLWLGTRSYKSGGEFFMRPAKAFICKVCPCFGGGSRIGSYMRKDSW